MTYVAGADGTRGGWAVVPKEAGRPTISRKVLALSILLDARADCSILAVDVRIGLLDAYELGGRVCDRKARERLGKLRSSSVFPAPVFLVLGATSWDDACARAWASSSHCKAISKQTFAILPKIREVDDLLRVPPKLRGVVREVHPDVRFAEPFGKPMTHKMSLGPGAKSGGEPSLGLFAYCA